MARQPLSETYPSEDLYSSKLLVERGEPVRSLVDDGRLDALSAELKTDIIKAGWAIPANEKEIVNDAMRLMYSRKYYGEYDQQIAKMGEKLAEAHDLEQAQSDRLKQLPNGSIQRELLFLKMKDSFEKTSKLQDEYNKYYESRGGYFLRDYKIDTLVCEEQAAVMSYTLESVGIHNDYCSTDAYLNGSVPHSFLQSRLTGNIIEVTNPNNSYRINLSNTYVRNGKPVLTRNQDGGFLQFYGEGSTDYTGNLGNLDENVDYRGTRANQDVIDNQAKVFAEYERKFSAKPDFTARSEERDSISLSQAEKNISIFLMKRDKKEFDGKLSFEEAVAGLQENGIKLCEGEIKALKVVLKQPDSIANSISNNVNLVRYMDSNHDGIITEKEFNDVINGVTKPSYSTANHSPLTLDNQIKLLHREIFGKN